MEHEPTSEKTAREYAEEIIESKLAVSPTSVETLGMGIGGAVMKIETEKGIFVLKMIRNEPPVAIGNEETSDRVYSGRWTEFESAYTTMQQAKLPLPAIHATDYTIDNSHYYILMDYIDGESAREYMSKLPNDDSLHETIGSMFGKMHTVTRPYQGWTSMKDPYKDDWGTAFFSALNNQINEIKSRGHLSKKDTDRLYAVANTYQSEWIEPAEFVLSHLDGFQGIVAGGNGDWLVGGIIDIEDHQYTDQRFVLCGHELAMEAEGQKLPGSFWDGYSSQKTIDPTHRHFAPLFKLYYLSVWLCVFTNESIGDIPNRAEKAENITRMISLLLDSAERKSS
jgi:fructosamine-3-kinase